MKKNLGMNNKEILLDFINRYYLDGLIERSVISVQNENLYCESYNGEQQLYCIINMNRNPFDEKNVDLTVTDTNAFIRLLKAFEDPDISIYYSDKNMNDNDPHSLVIKENEIRSNFLLSKRGIVQPHGKDFKTDIECDFEFDVTEDFVEQFNKFKFLLKDESRSFSFFQREGNIFLLFGINRFSGSNNVSIDMGLEPNSDFRDEIIFPIDSFYSILKNNADADIHVKVLHKAMIVTCHAEHFDNIYVMASSKNKS